MSKEAISTMKLEPDLRAEFIAEAKAAHQPASQVLRELMREFIQRQRGHTMLFCTRRSKPAAPRAGSEGYLDAGSCTKNAPKYGINSTLIQ
jgi:hypothetical protein